MNYKNPTLVEIYVKLNLADGLLPEAKFFDIVPLLKNNGLSTLELAQAIRSRAQPTELPITPRVRCRDEEKLRLVQLDRDVLVINQTKKYLGWETFKELIESTLQAVRNAGVELRFKSIELHTFDKFIAPREDYRLGDWLNCDGSMIPRWYKESTEACDIDLGLGLLAVDKKNRQLHVHVRPKEEGAEIRFNAAFEDATSDTTDFDSVLESLHRESTGCFETIITDRVRIEIMQGKETE